MSDCAGIKVKAQHSGGYRRLVQRLDLAPLIKLIRVDLRHGEEGTLGIACHSPLLVDLVRLAVRIVLKVHALFSIIEHVAQLCVRIYHVKELQTLFRIFGIYGNHVERASHGLVGENRVSQFLNHYFFPHLRSPDRGSRRLPALCNSPHIVNTSL